MSYYIDFFAPDTPYLRLVGVTRLGVALSEFVRARPAASGQGKSRIIPSIPIAEKRKLLEKAGKRLEDYERHEECVFARESKEYYVDQLAKVFVPYMHRVNITVPPATELFAWVYKIVAFLESNGLCRWMELDDGWNLKRTELGNSALKSLPRPATIVDVDAAIRRVVQLAYCVRYDKTLAGDPRTHYTNLTPHGIYEWLEHLGVEKRTSLVAVRDACTEGLILNRPGMFVGFDGYNLFERYTIAAGGEAYLGMRPPSDLITLAVASAEYHVGRQAIQLAIDDGSLTSYRPANAAKNSPHWVSRQDVASRWLKR